MASGGLRVELECSLCLDIYTDPVTLRCGHNFCRVCIDRVLDSQEGSGGYSCPECRERFQERTALQRNIKLRNIVENFQSTQPSQEVFCSHCVDFPVPAVKSCLLCEVSLCDKHLRVHSKAPDHVLCDPTTSLESRKCSVHKKILEYYCTEDAACVCVSCYVIGGHVGHKMESLDEASEEKKKQLRTYVEKLIKQTEKNKERVQSLEKRRKKSQEKADGETQRVSILFTELRKRLEDLEKKVLSDITKQAMEISSKYNVRIQQLEIKKAELSRKMRHIEELCNMTDPLTVLQESHTGDLCDLEEGDGEETESDTGESCDMEEEDEEEEEDEDSAESDTGESCDMEEEDEEEEEDEDSAESDTGDLLDMEEGDEEEEEEEEGAELDTGDLCDMEEGDEEEEEEEDEGSAELDTGDLCDMEDRDEGEEEEDEENAESDTGDLLDTEEGDEEEEEDEESAESDTGDLCDTEDRHDEQLHDGGDLDLAGISHTLHTGLADIMSGVTGRIYNYLQPADILLDVNTAGYELRISADRKTASWSFVEQQYPETPERFEHYNQVLSSQSFSSGQHYWEVDVGGSEWWIVGMCYPSIDKWGDRSEIGYTKRSWGLYRYNNKCFVIHGRKEIQLPADFSSDRVRIDLDYEAGQISFYDRCDPIRHLHTFSATFTEPLHAGIGLGGGCVRISE
ncbi:E3 ubiquitin/ISG15 ligase TRIM25-like [Hyperolius riggenbachi]|uniref:E3 ubiquitin/ISG15 ligase TRIM25-like n=1 Tax=Hyperolius riggenbachi TaxID=752182 RepID=UPI0035A3C893